MSFNILGALYRFEAVKMVKNVLRPLKHRIWGPVGLYWAIAEVARLSGGAKRVTTICDVGSANGEYAVQFLRSFPNATVHCFEPHPESFADLVRRTTPFRGRVKCHQYALADLAGERAFFIAPSPNGSSLIDEGDPKSERITVEVRCLDDVARAEGMTRIDLLKIDVEGAELEVLRGGAETVRRAVRSAFIEIQPVIKGYYSPDHVAIFEELQEAGFGFGGVSGDYFFSKLLPKK